MTGRRSLLRLAAIAAAVAGAFLAGGLSGPGRARTGAPRGPDAVAQAPVDRAAADTGVDAARSALQLRHPVERINAFAAVLAEPAGTGRFARILHDLDCARRDPAVGGAPDEIHDLMLLLADAWAGQDPAGAAEALCVLEVPGWRNPLLFSALSRWACDDAASVRRWVDQRYPAAPPETPADGQAEAPSYYLAAIVRGLAAVDADRAATALLAMPPGPSPTSAMEFVLQAYLARGSEAARNWAAGLPASNRALRTAALSLVASRLFARGPEPLLAWAGTLPEDVDRKVVVAAVAAAWGRIRPQEAAAWAEAVAEPALRIDALANVADEWARTDPAAAAAWLARQPETAGTDLAWRRYAWVTLRWNPDGAFRRAAGIRAHGMRDETLEQLGRIWITEQPQEAAAYVRASPHFPEAVRDRLLEMVEP